MSIHILKSGFFSARPLWAVLAALFLALPFAAQATGLNPDIYNYTELRKVMNKISTDYNTLQKEQKSRIDELTTIKRDLPKYEKTATRSEVKKDRKDAAQKIDDMKRRQQVLSQKIAYFTPKLTELKNQYAVLSKAYQARTAEFNRMPKGSASDWTVAQAQLAAKIYKNETARSRFRLAYYQRAFSNSAPDVQEAARRENFLAAAVSEVRATERLYQQYDSIAQNIINEAEYKKNEKGDEGDDFTEKQTKPQQQPNVVPVVAAKPQTQAPAVAAAPEQSAPPVTAQRLVSAQKPAPPPQDFDLVSGFDQFIDNHRLVTFLATLIAASLSIFFGVQITDSDNQRHRVIPSIIWGGLTAVCFSVPFFGAPLGFLCFVLAFPFYYKIPSEALVRTLPVSLSLLAVSGLALIGLAWAVVK